MLFVFVELAALHHRGRRDARSDSGKIRQRETVGHALRRRTVFGAVRQDRRGDVVRNLWGAAWGLPDLHARRHRKRDGAAQTWAGGVDVIPYQQGGHYAVAAWANSSSSSSSTGENVLSGLVESVIGLRLP